MAKKTEATLVLKVKTMGLKGIDFVRDKFSGLKQGFANFKNVAFGVIGVLAAIGTAIGKLALTAAKTDDVKRAFKNMAASQGQDSKAMLANMKEMSKGTISELNLMQQANQALLLGLPVERFGDMLKIARSSAKATGQSMEFMLQSIVTGIGRSSRLMLDNLGIIVDTGKANDEYARSLGKTASKLTDAEKKQAFLNKSLEIGLANVEKAGKAVDSATDIWEQLKASISDTAAVLGSKASPIFTFFIKGLKSASDGLKNLFKEDTTGQLQQQLNRLVRARSNNIAMMEKARIKQEEKIRLQKEETSLWDRIKRKLTEVESENGKAAASRVEQLDKEIAKIRATMDARDVAAGRDLKQQQDGLVKAKEIAAQKLAMAEAEKVKAQEKVEFEKELKALENEDKQEAERLHQEALKNVQNEAEFEAAKDSIKSAEGIANKKKAIDKKNQIREGQIAAQRKLEMTKVHQFEMWLNSQKVSNASAVFGQISTLQNSSSKELVAIGRAAAIAQIAINTARGIMMSYATFPFPIASVFAGLVATAGAVQSAQVAGVKLAEGGVVSATPGGVSAIIGEGGRDEAVVPLDDDDRTSGLGNTINIVVNGGMLGDEQSAREFARVVDEEMLKLRQDNESVAFEGIV